MKNQVPFSLRQGDVLLVEASYYGIKTIPADAKQQEVKDGKVVLALGEVTGHHHRYEFRDTSQDVTLRVGGSGARYLSVTAPADLLHEEHDTAYTPVGDYVLPRQVEYAPAALRNVAD